MKRLARFLLLLVAAFWPAAIGFAQQTSAIEIVELNTSRYDQGGSVTMVVEFRNLQSALDPSQLEVTANGGAVEGLSVQRLAETRDPVAIALVIDVSGSMEGAPIEAAKAAATAFVDSKRDGDFLALLTFGDTVQTLSGFTADGNALRTRIAELTAGGATAFNDAVLKGIDLFDTSGANTLRKNLIVLSDGADEGSVATFDQVLNAVSTPSNQVRIFGVALESSNFNPAPIQQLAEASEGLYLATPDPAQLAGLYSQIQQEINNLLVVRFNSPVAAGGEVDFQVSYAGGLTAAQTASVIGYVVATSTTQAPTTTFAQPEGRVIQSSLPADPGVLKMLGAIGVGVAVGLFLLILFGRGADDAGGALRRRLEAYGKRRGPDEEKKSILERLPLLRLFSQRAEEEVRRRGLLSGVNAALEQANVPISAGEAVTGALGLSVVVGLLAALFTGSPLMGLAFGVGWVLFVFAFISWTGGREKRKFESQLPDTLTLIATSLRAGYSLLQAVEAVAAEAPNPTAREFGRAIAEARLGRQVTSALDGITQRTQSKDFEWAVMAIEIQREVGGNLAEVLQTVADTMLQRNRLRGEIRALTAEGRISAIVLGALPFVMALFLWTSNRDYIQLLFERTFGVVAVIVGALLLLGGIFWLRKIVNIEV